MSAPIPGWRIARWYIRRLDQGVGGWFGDVTEIEDFTCDGCARAAYDELLPQVTADSTAPTKLHGVELYPITLHPHPEEPPVPCPLHCTAEPTWAEKLKDWWRRRRPSWDRTPAGVAVA